VDKFLGKDWLVGMDSVCRATLSLSQDEGYSNVEDTSAKMEGQNVLENGYDALVEVYCALLLDGHGIDEKHVPSEQASSMYQ